MSKPQSTEVKQLTLKETVQEQQSTKSTEEEAPQRVEGNFSQGTIMSWGEKGTKNDTPSAEIEDNDSDTPEETSPEFLPTREKVLDPSCPECSGEVRYDGNDYFCSDCGVLISDTMLDVGPEWRSYDDDKQITRVGSPMNKTIHDKGLSTVIAGGNRDAKGNVISNDKRGRINRLRKWNTRFATKNSREENIQKGFTEIKRMSSELDVADHVEETACTVYRRASEEDLLPGRSIEGVATASIYIAARQSHIPITIDQTVEYSRIKEQEFLSTFKHLQQELNLEIEPPKIQTFLTRIASELEVDSETERLADDLVEQVVTANMHSGKSPSGMAAAAIYAASVIQNKKEVTQKEAADAADVCALTIRSRYQSILELVGSDTNHKAPA